MRLSSKLTAPMIDLVGGGLFATCVTGFVWLLLFHNEATNARIEELRQCISAGQRDATVLEKARVAQQDTLTSRQAELAKTGQVPSKAPIEEYFRLLSQIAAGQKLEIMRQNPLGSRWYPGLQEQRWAYEIRGSTTDLVRFLKAIENIDYWADVSYLRIDRGNGTEEVAVNQRVASLTISFFSAPPPEGPDDAEGT